MDTVVPVAAVPKALVHGGITTHGWKITTVKGPIIADRDLDDYRQQIGTDVITLPEMLFNRSRLTLLHEASGVALDFNALDALRGWQEEGLPPLQVSVAQEWRRAREHEIKQQQAVQLQYDWTYTTPYCGTVCRADAQQAKPTTGADAGAGPQGVAGASPAPEMSGGSVPAWHDTTDQIDRGLLMERDPILFYDEVPLYESDLDDNGVCQLTAKLRVMPKCWFVLLRLWIRVDGSLVRLRETRLFCRHDMPERAHVVLREVKHVEGGLKELRAAGAPDDAAAYADADSAAAVFQAVAPIGHKKLQLSKLELR
mmetsp:Transcript_6371/g.14150  ORF Transcript_6371/g.14150 Transcript_6371/m.14150 type:complete len:312 (-) Transcript_6371:336-1271(-)|eukprot:CAMPEP_0202891648 /NCGR_PEP_ID=MMETSP1392-20130828/1659_1 /ASSEMBLY_ACC=CAM_ASM_000868 /TAXON_ID=225041 /ORGANISM="Chlamydomonas chlamydogama, Strain SAG 11-48b" /LENGTH=311 /DNA_ID=CAMNT_0049575467 /DNA_START=167 /DNA_END=1102 /DNA_ORIENTATION=-